MGKTKPIGVRFDEELLGKLKSAGIASSPQKALNLYEKAYVDLIEKKIEENNPPNEKAKIESERTSIPAKSKPAYPLSINEAVEIPPPPPTRQPGENAIDFAIRKNEWKDKWGKI